MESTGKDRPEAAVRDAPNMQVNPLEAATLNLCLC